MKFIGRIVTFVFIIFIFTSIFAFGCLGLVPYLSDWLKTNRPRDLGIKYNQENLIVARAKANQIYETLPSSTPDEKSIKWSGSHKVNDYWTSAEITALMNNRPWKNWPYKDVQVKFNSDGSAEIAGTIIKNKVPGYAAAIGAPKPALNIAMKLLPANPVFYLKIKANLKNNKVNIFQPQIFQIGRVTLPIKQILSFNPRLVKTVNADFSFAILDDLKNIRNKKDLLIFYINTRLASIPGFYVKEFKFEDNKLKFEGSLPNIEATVR